MQGFEDGRMQLEIASLVREVPVPETRGLLQLVRE